MKDHYVGDINDFFKYDLLEKITKTRKCLIVWMKTGGDGNKLSYLEKTRYEKYNQKLFESLRNIILGNKRTLENIKTIKSLSNCIFIEDKLSKKCRQSYFEKVYKLSKETETSIVFFDPDNGISPNKNQKEVKYIYWDELKKIWDLKKDILVYQSYRRISGVTHDEFISIIMKNCKEELEGANVMVFKTKGVFFIYMTHKETKEFKKINQEWSELEE